MADLSHESLMCKSALYRSNSDTVSALPLAAAITNGVWLSPSTAFTSASLEEGIWKDAYIFPFTCSYPSSPFKIRSKNNSKKVFQRFGIVLGASLGLMIPILNISSWIQRWFDLKAQPLLNRDCISEEEDMQKSFFHLIVVIYLPLAKVWVKRYLEGIASWISASLD